MVITKIIEELSLTPDKNIPLYFQSANSLTVKIQSSELPNGTKLPPDKELDRLLNSSRTTSLNTYRQLEENGLIQSRRVNGTYAANPRKCHVEISMPWEQFRIDAGASL